jgi:AraC family transcriptional regulator, regulatory protein of adaptative response / methylated-DNA-[protein]-cysteine methyltransferase
MLTTEKKYQAFVDKEAIYDGAFYIAVKTTGIFCRTVCTARKAKRENVEFYDTIQEAMTAGYRPCKICRPMESVGKIPEEIQVLINEVEAQPNFKIQEWQLRERGFDPNTLRRWFQTHYGMSFQAFCRMYRINVAFGTIKDGNSVIDTAFESGYESSSGFIAAYEKIIGSTPGKTKAMTQEILVYKRFDTPLGPMIAIASSIGLCLLEFGDRRILETEFKDLGKRLKAVIVPGHNIYTDQAIAEILEYFEGMRTKFTVQLHTPGTDFQNKVWMALQDIPFGETTSYNELAKRIMNPKAVRAVGRANGMNRIAIIIPCHRVIGADGELTGYGGGIWRKEWLIKHETNL